MQYNLIDLIFFFIVYGFSGFLLESSFATLVGKKLAIREGFLTNYFCPLYGLCAIVIIQIFTLCEITFDSRFYSLITSTIGSILAVTFLEYVAGRLLDKVFHHKMWDYSDYPLNLHSYICLDFSLMWGILALLLSNFIHPLIEFGVLALNDSLKYNMIVVIFSILIVNASYNMRRLIPSNYKLIID